MIQCFVGLGDFAKQRLTVSQPLLIVCRNYKFVGTILDFAEVDDFISTIDEQVYLSALPCGAIFIGKRAARPGMNIADDTVDPEFFLDLWDMFDDYVRYYQNDGRKWFRAPSVIVINNNKNYNKIAKRFQNESRSCIGGHSISNSIQVQPPASFSQGQEILSSSGHPLWDAVIYAQKADNAVSQDERWRYLRKSIAALSEPYQTQNKKPGPYNSLSSKIERALISSTIISNDKHKEKQKIINDYKEVIDIAQYELSNNSDLAPEKKESYQFVISEAQKVTESIVEQEVEDEELKRLREDLKRKQLTLLELKKSQGEGK